MMKTVLLAVALVLAASASAASTSDPVSDILRSKDPVLQRGLEGSLKGLGLSDDAAGGRLAVALMDVSDPEHPRLAEVNGETMMYAASLPKIAILLGAFERIHEGAMELDPQTRRCLTDMIRRSSNTAASEMLGRVGGEYVCELMTSPRYQFYDPEHGGGLWVGKPYGSAPAFRRDPLKQLSHAASPLQVARFYWLLSTGRLVSPELSVEMKKILGMPAIHHKFVKGLSESRPGSAIYRKSGTWRDWHADSALIERDGKRYIAVALARSAEGGEWLSKLIVAMDDLIFKG